MIMETIVYGGAFDPPQLAHQDLVEQLDRTYRPAKIIIVPSGPRYDKTYKVSDEHRQNILRIFADALKDRMAHVELCEDFMLGLIPETTTLGMDEFFRERLGRSPRQVFGMDVIPQMPVWDPSGRVEQEIPKIFVSREGFEPDMHSLDNYLLFNPKFPEHIAALSSTAVRANIKNRIFTGLNPRVEAYIKENNLYQ